MFYRALANVTSVVLYEKVGNFPVKATTFCYISVGCYICPGMALHTWTRICSWPSLPWREWTYREIPSIVTANFSGWHRWVNIILKTVHDILGQGPAESSRYLKSLSPSWAPMHKKYRSSSDFHERRRSFDMNIAISRLLHKHIFHLSWK